MKFGNIIKDIGDIDTESIGVIVKVDGDASLVYWVTGDFKGREYTQNNRFLKVVNRTTKGMEKVLPYMI